MSLELGHPNPHLFRHVAACYQLIIRRDENMAARLLNDDPETVRKYYADVLVDSRAVCKDFFDTFKPQDEDPPLTEG